MHLGFGLCDVLFPVQDAMTSRCSFLWAVGHDEKMCDRETCVVMGYIGMQRKKDGGRKWFRRRRDKKIANAMKRRLDDKGRLHPLPWKLFVA